LATLCSSGIRVDEATRLQWWQIKPFQHSYMLLVRGKTDEDYRQAYLSVTAHDLLMQWKAAQPIRSPFVFTAFYGPKRIPLEKPVSKTGLWKIVIHYANRCDIPNVKPHDLRRFLGTQLAKQDIRKAQKALGHKNIQTTARHYVLDELEAGLTDNLY
jgi:integrase